MSTKKNKFSIYIYVVITIIGCVLAVSYTHLDVYKRQVTIDANLNYYVAFGNQREKQVSFEEITPFLQDSYAKEPEMFVALYADETVPYKEIVRILNIANQNKFKMVLATRSQK